MPSQPPQRPDLAIYSQEEQLGRNADPTWISPDINYRFTEVNVRVRNLSAAVGAVNVRVNLSVSQLGIGFPRTPVSSQSLSLKALQEVALVFPLPRSLVGTQGVDDFNNGGRGYHVNIEHPYDAVVVNNRGSLMALGLRVQAAGVQDRFELGIYNDAASPRELHLGVLQNQLGAAVNPTVRLLGPREQAIAVFSINSALAVNGMGATVVGRWADGTLVDGISFIIW